MKRNAIAPPRRREFLKLAALTGAAALTGGGSPTAAEPSAVTQSADRHEGAGTMPFLRVSGRQIVDAQGKKVRLRGTCPGGWMNMEDFINGHPGAEHTLRAQMAEVLGPAKAQFFFDRLLDYFFNEDDVIFLRKAGATVVRFPLNYRHFEDDTAPFKYKEAGFARLDQVLNHCEKHGLYVILDLHSAQGWQNVHWHSDNASRISLFWEVAYYQDRFVALWQEFARRYKNRGVIAGYDVLNEPCSNNDLGDYPWNIYSKYKPNFDRMNSVYRRLVTEIRKIDPKHIIFLEGDNYAKQFSGFDAPFDDNLAYSSHNYTVPGFGPGQYPGMIHPRSAAQAPRHGTSRSRSASSLMPKERNSPSSTMFRCGWASLDRCSTVRLTRTGIGFARWTIRLASLSATRRTGRRGITRMLA